MTHWEDTVVSGLMVFRRVKVKQIASTWNHKLRSQIGRTCVSRWCNLHEKRQLVSIESQLPKRIRTGSLNEDETYQAWWAMKTCSPRKREYKSLATTGNDKLQWRFDLFIFYPFLQHHSITIFVSLYSLCVDLEMESLCLMITNRLVDFFTL